MFETDGIGQTPSSLERYLVWYIKNQQQEAIMQQYDHWYRRLSRAFTFSMFILVLVYTA